MEKEENDTKPVTKINSKEFVTSMKENASWMACWKVLRTARIHHLKTQQELAQMTGFNQMYISKLELGRMNPTIRTLFRIAEALDSDLVIEFRKRSK